MPTDEESRAAGSARVHDLLLHEFDHFSESYLRNENLGEARVTILVSAVGAAAALISFKDLGPPQNNGGDAAAWSAILALFVVLGMGLLTLVRLMKRNSDTDTDLRVLHQVRSYYLVHYFDDLKELRYPFVAPKDKGSRKRSWRTKEFLMGNNGGNLEVVEWANAFAGGLLVIALCRVALPPPLLPVFIAVVLFLVVAVACRGIEFWAVNWWSAKLEKKALSDTKSAADMARTNVMLERASYAVTVVEQSRESADVQVRVDVMGTIQQSD